MSEKEIINEIIKKLSHTWEDMGIGAYEYWGCRGNDVDWQPVFNEKDVVIILPIEIESIPIKLKGTYTADSSGDAHCTGDTVSLNFVAELVAVRCRLTVGRNEKSYLAEYSIESE